MRFRFALLAAAAAVTLLAPAQTAFAQRGGGARVGKVKSVDTGAKSFVITARRQGQEADITIKTDDQTHYMHGLANGTLNDVKAGSFAIVLGQGTPDTGITAREVFILDKEGGAPLGVVKSVDAAGKTFVVTTGRPGGEQRDVTIKVMDTTKYFSGRDPAKWEDLAAQKRVMIIGEGNPQTGFTAMYVRILPAGGGGGGQ